MQSNMVVRGGGDDVAAGKKYKEGIVVKNLNRGEEKR